MLATSEEIHAAWLNTSRQLSIRLKMNDITYGSEEITSLSFNSGSISGEVFQIGSTPLNSVQVVFPTIIETVKEDLEIEPELGILINGEYQFTKLGHFFITDFERDRNSNKTTITANDKMIYMEGIYESKLTYPKPYREVALEIANLAGVEIDQASFASLGTEWVQKPVGYTFRQAIGLIAQFEGGFASFNRKGELTIKRLAPTNFEITPESYMLKGFTKNENSYRIGGITVKTGEEETDVIRVGSTNGSQVELENKVMTQTHLNQMWELVKTLNYFPYELKWRGSPILEAGDWIYIVDKDGTRYSVPNLSYNITFNGGMSSESKANTNSSSQATYRYRGPLNQRVDYVESLLSANKWNSNYYDQTEPIDPKEGDIWFKPNGVDTEIWVYEKNSSGELDWVFKVSTATDPDLVKEIEQAKQAGENAQEAADQAKTDSANALSNANNAVSKANEASVKADQSNAAANQAKADASSAISNANTAKQDAQLAVSNAQNALNAANSAKTDAQAAIDKFKELGMFPAYAWSADGTDRFTTQYPNENYFLGSQTAKIGDLEAAARSGKEYQTLNIGTTWVDNFESGDRAVISFDIVMLKGLQLTVYNSNRKGPFIFTSKLIRNVGTEKTRLEVNTVLTKRTDATLDYDTIEFYSVYDTSDFFEITNVKIEKAESATDTATIYTPAPADDFTNAYPTYIGFSNEKSTNPEDYTWIKDPNKVDGEVKVELSEINGELSRKVSQDKFNTLEGTVGNQTTKITQNTNAITQKADSSTVNTLTGRVSTAEGQITTMAGQIEIKANKTDVETISGKVTSVESSLNTQAGQITALNTKTDGHTTQIGSLQSSYSGLSSTVSSVKNDLDNLSVGARNYLPNSESPKVANYLGSTITYTENQSVTEWKATNAVKHNVTGGTNVIVGTLRANRIITANVNYIHSIYISNTGTKAMRVHNNISQFLDVPAGTTARLVWNPAKQAAGTAAMQFVFYRNVVADDLEFIIWHAMIAEGTIVNDWVPSPEDQVSVVKFSSFVQRVDTIQTTVSNKADQSQVTQLASQWQQTTDLANGHTSQISSLGDQLNVRVQKDDVINQINLSTEEILIAGNKVRITGQTTIEDGVIGRAQIANLAVGTAQIADAAITDAKIGSLSATKITTGTLNASNVNIINLNANSIVSGTLNAIDLTGGRITQSDSGEYSMELLKGSIYFRRSTNELARIQPIYVSKEPVGLAIVQMPGEVFSINTGSATDTTSMPIFQIPDTSSRTNMEWKMYGLGNVDAIVNFNNTVNAKLRFISTNTVEAKRIVTGNKDSYVMQMDGDKYLSVEGEYGVRIKHNQSGSLYTPIEAKYNQIKLDVYSGANMTLKTDRLELNNGGDSYFSNAPAGISLGLDSTPRIWSMAIYNRTYSSASNMFITNAGTIGRSTSARKYKEDIQVADEVISKAKRFLSILPSSWYDKAEIARGDKPQRHYGFVADDFDNKGLKEVVLYGSSGQVEGLAYDRLTMYQNVILSDHEQEIQSLKKEVSQLKNKLKELEAA